MGNLFTTTDVPKKSIHKALKNITDKQDEHTDFHFKHEANLHTAIILLLALLTLICCIAGYFIYKWRKRHSKRNRENVPDIIQHNAMQPVLLKLLQQELCEKATLKLQQQALCENATVIQVANQDDLKRTGG